MPDLKDLECYVVAYGRPERAQETIDSFRSSGGDVKVTVFDNFITPSSFKGVDAYYHFPFNPSLTRVWNWAIAMAKTPWVLLSNDDIDYLTGWVDVFKNDEHMQKSKLHSRFSSTFIHRSLIRQVGWFDERFTTWYWEDTDFARRANNLRLPMCIDDCPINAFRVDVRSPEAVKSFYRDNVFKFKNTPQFEEKWGDLDPDWHAGGSPKWPNVNWYPHVVLPE